MGSPVISSVGQRKYFSGSGAGLGSLSALALVGACCALAACQSSGDSQKAAGEPAAATVETAKPAAVEAAPLDAGKPLPKAYGDTILMGTIGDASNLIPMASSDSASHTVASYLFDGLLDYDKTLSTLEPRLAERWEISDDGLTITFFLRRDVRWTDGAPFTARDVEFAFHLIRDPATLTAYAEDYRQVERFDLLDDHTFRVTYSKPFAPALSTWNSMVVLPKHLLEGQNINETKFGREPVGLGSYKLDSWETGTKIQLVSNHDYYRGRPYLERVVYRVIPDLATQFMELKTGGLDMMGLTPVQFRRQTATEKFRSEFAKYRYLANSYTYLGYNLQNPLFQDVRIRQAFTHAINKQEIVDAVLMGLGRPAYGPYKPGTIWSNDDVPKYRFDPDKAMAMLAEAGWLDTDGDGVLDKDGKPFRFTLLTNHGNDNRSRTATIIQKRLRDVGVDVDIRIIEWSAFINEFIDKRKFDAVILGWSLSQDPDQYDIWHSTKTGLKEFNFISYENKEVDRILDEGRRVFGVDDRKAYYDRFQEILAEEQPYTFLYVAESLPAVHRRFHGIEPAPKGIGYNFHEWYVPKPFQKYALAR